MNPIHSINCQNPECQGECYDANEVSSGPRRRDPEINNALGTAAEMFYWMSALILGLTVLALITLGGFYLLRYLLDFIQAR